MNAVLKEVLDAAYNGVCLEAENGNTERWRCQDVGAPMRNQFIVTTKLGKRLRVLVAEVE